MSTEAYCSDQALDLVPGTHLLLDESLVEDRWGLERVLHQPDKFLRNPILIRDKPWEGDTAYRACVFHDPARGCYRMYYQCFSMAVYADNSGLPSSRLGMTVETGVNSTGGWQEIALSAPVSVSAGQKVWLAWVYETTPLIRYKTGTPGRAATTQTWSGGMPVTFGASTTANYVFSIYANVKESSSSLRSVVSIKSLLTEYDISKKVDYSVYPNPIENDFSIEFNVINEDAFVSLSVIDQQGRLLKIVFEETLSSCHQKMNFDRVDVFGSHVKAGLYLLRLKIGEEIYHKRIILK